MKLCLEKNINKKKGGSMIFFLVFLSICLVVVATYATFTGKANKGAKETNEVLQEQFKKTFEE